MMLCYPIDEFMDGFVFDLPFFVGNKDELGALRIPSKDDKGEREVIYLKESTFLVELASG